MPTLLLRLMCLFFMVTNTLFGADAQLIHENNPQSLKPYISKADYEKFYTSLKLSQASKKESEFLAKSHSKAALSQEEAGRLAFFYIESKEITPAIVGYMAFNVRNSNLVAYILSENLGYLNEHASIRKRRLS